MRESSLASVFCVVSAAQRSPTDRQHHRPMSLDQRSKRRLVAMRHKAVEQLMVRLRLCQPWLQQFAQLVQ